MIDFVLVRTVPVSTQDSDGRFEFRSWPEGPTPAAARLQGLWVLESSERRADIYLVTAFSPEILVKLRDGSRFEIKQRAPDRGILQHWTCPVSELFPLTRPTLAVAARALQLPGRLNPRAGLSAAHLLAELAAYPSSVTPVTVEKARLTFLSGSSRAEICRATILGRRRVTLALDDPDPASALSAVKALGLADQPNLSYGDMLCALPLELQESRHRP